MNECINQMLPEGTWDLFEPGSGISITPLESEIKLEAARAQVDGVFPADLMLVRDSDTYDEDYQLLLPVIKSLGRGIDFQIDPSLTGHAHVEINQQAIQVIDLVPSFDGSIGQDTRIPSGQPIHAPALQPAQRTAHLRIHTQFAQDVPHNNLQYTRRKGSQKTPRKTQLHTTHLAHPQPGTEQYLPIPRTEPNINRFNKMISLLAGSKDSITQGTYEKNQIARAYDIRPFNAQYQWELLFQILAIENRNHKIELVRIDEIPPLENTLNMLHGYFDYEYASGWAAVFAGDYFIRRTNGSWVGISRTFAFYCDPASGDLGMLTLFEGKKRVDGGWKPIKEKIVEKIRATQQAMERQDFNEANFVSPQVRAF
ncbi:hypothetical protein ABW20_dc0102019 [Dactylellina cionopaga]|nr:hypothetical protein ABW20_dc0102019 [Dactylellina cionopaga]